MLTHRAARRCGARPLRTLGKRIIRQPIPNLAATEQRNGEITSHFQLLPVRTEAHQRTVEGAIARIRDGAVIVRVSVPPHPLDEGQPQKTSAGTLARGADLHEGTLIDASALRDLEPALGPAGPLVHLLPQAHGREVGSSARETGGVPRSIPDGASRSIPND